MNKAAKIASGIALLAALALYFDNMSSANSSTLLEVPEQLVVSP